MKIKNLGFGTFKITGEKVSIITDPDSLKEAGQTLPPVDAEICLFSDIKHVGEQDILKNAGLEKKITTEKREKVFELSNYGEYAIGDMFIRRPIRGGYFLLDEGYLRVVYTGLITPDFEISTLKDLGDVDILIIPVGDGEIFPSFQKLEKIISSIDPTYLIPCCYKSSGLSEKYKTLKTVDEFLKDYGIADAQRMKELKVSNAPEKEEKSMQVVILE